MLNSIVKIEGEGFSNAYINSMDILDDGTLICVTNSGNVYTVNDGNVSLMEFDADSDKINSVSAYKKGWFFETEKNTIYKCEGSADSFKVENQHVEALKISII